MCVSVPPPQPQQPQPEPTYWQKINIKVAEEEAKNEKMRYFKNDEYDLVVEAKKTTSIYYPDVIITVEHIRKVTNVPWFLQKLDVDVNFNVTNNDKFHKIRKNLGMYNYDTCDASCWYEENYPCEHDGKEVKYTNMTMKIVPNGSEGPVESVKPAEYAKPEELNNWVDMSVRRPRFY